jgi:predicted metalloprotease
MLRRFTLLLIISMTMVACSSTADWTSHPRDRGASQVTTGGNPTVPVLSTVPSEPTTSPSPITSEEPSEQPPVNDAPSSEAPTTEPTTTEPTTTEPTTTDPVDLAPDGFDSEATIAEPAVFESEIGPSGPDAANTTAYLLDVINHADTVWTNWFVANGLAEPLVGYDIIQPGSQYDGTCGTVISSTPNAYYCPTDINSFGDPGMIILPVETMMKMWGGNIFERQVTDPARVGDFAAAMLVAHEFGHHIAHELQLQLGLVAPSDSENLADCFSGVWAYAVYLDGYLEVGDIEEALAAVAAIGDFNPASRHGTPTERQNAFSIGFYGSQANPVGGVPTNCMQAFWTEAYA